jgi:hypothetical protein
VPSVSKHIQAEDIVKKLNLTGVHFVGLHDMVYLINLYTQPDDGLFLS